MSPEAASGTALCQKTGIRSPAIPTNSAAVSSAPVRSSASRRTVVMPDPLAANRSAAVNAARLGQFRRDHGGYPVPPVRRRRQALMRPASIVKTHAQPPAHRTGSAPGRRLCAGHRHSPHRTPRNHALRTRRRRSSNASRSVSVRSDSFDALRALQDLDLPAPPAETRAGRARVQRHTRECDDPAGDRHRDARPPHRRAPDRRHQALPARAQRTSIAPWTEQARAAGAPHGTADPATTTPDTQVRGISASRRNRLLPGTGAK
jgi:hypothetical protein